MAYDCHSKGFLIPTLAAASDTKEPKAFSEQLLKNSLCQFYHQISDRWQLFTRINRLFENDMFYLTGYTQG